MEPTNNKLGALKKNKLIIIAIALMVGVFGLGGSARAAIFLDNGTTGCSNGAINYDPNTRSCGSGADTVYDNLGDFNNNIIASGTNYIRAGRYWRNSGSWSEGALNIDKDGTASNRTIVSAYPGEERQAIIYTESGKDQYNPNPADTSVGGQGLYYYPCPAITIGSDYTDVIGLKTYGQVLIAASNSTLQDSDLGGGGSYYNWGHVLYTHDSRDVTIRNNWIHHSPASGESNTHKAMVQSYRSRDIVYEYNTLSDAYEYGMACGDAQGVAGGAVTVRYNFIDSSQIGWMGIAQYGHVDYSYVHNNIFYDNDIGIEWNIPAAIKTIVYSNTFVNCGKDINTWMNGEINVFNNLYYHPQSGQRYYDIQADPISTQLYSDYNLFYSLNSDTAWYNLYSNRGSTLSAWRSYSGKDGNSVSKDPGFVNPTGSNPEDFKRTDYSGDVSGSPYGIVTGAYITGNEVIGLLSGTSNTTPPSRSFSSPNGILSSGTTSTNISLETNKQAVCRYSNTSNTNYTDMEFNFTNTNSTNHSTLVSGLENGQTYTYFIRCNSTEGYVNEDDWNITFSVGGHKADTNLDGIINMPEFMAYIARWKADDNVSKAEVEEARDIWFTGGVY